MNLAHLLRPVTAVETALLGPWAARLPAGVRPLALTAFGDWFLRAPGGSVLFLDTTTGEVSRAAGSLAELKLRVEDPQLRQRWLLAEQVELLRQAGVLPGPGQCYAWRVAPARGGSLLVDNVVVRELNRHQELAAAAVLCAPCAKPKPAPARGPVAVQVAVESAPGVEDDPTPATWGGLLLLFLVMPVALAAILLDLVRGARAEAGGLEGSLPAA